MDMNQKRKQANVWIDGFIRALVTNYGTDGVMLEDGILYVEIMPGIWVDFTRPEFNENLSLVGAAGLVRRNREGVNEHVRWFNLFKSRMDAWNMDQSIDFHESSIGGARAYVQLVINDYIPVLEDSDAEYLRGFMPNGGEDWQELAKSMYKICAFCYMPGWSMYLDPIPEIYTK